MRTFQIDFLNPENMLPDGNILGNQGEHNATVLIITPPAEMTENEKIIYYRIAFELSNCRAVHSKYIEKSETIFFELFSDATSTDTLAIQLEGYDENCEVIIKSDKVKKLKLKESTCGVEIPPGGSPNSMAAEVTANTNFRNNFSEDENGNLIYKGNAIGAERPTATIPIQSKFLFWIDIGYGTLLCTASESIPVGTELKTIRIKYNDVMLDIKDMMSIDDIPYVLSMNKVYFSFANSMKVLASIGFIQENNAVIEAAKNSAVDEIEVEYYV